MEREATTKLGFSLTALPALLKKYTEDVYVTASSHVHTNFMNISIYYLQIFWIMDIIDHYS